MIVTQEWTHSLPMMQQTVLLTAIRGPDGLPKYAGVKMLLRWYRRCVLLSAIDGRVIETPSEDRGGSFTGPSISASCDQLLWEDAMDAVVDDYLRSLDAIPHHFQLHLMHAVEIVGYKHPDGRVSKWWREVYLRLVNDMHLHPETQPSALLGNGKRVWPD